MRRMFGKTGVFCDGVMFGMVTDNTLYVRVDDHNRAIFKEAAYGMPDEHGVVHNEGRSDHVFSRTRTRAMVSWEIEETIAKAGWRHKLLRVYPGAKAPLWLREHVAGLKARFTPKHTGAVAGGEREGSPWRKAAEALRVTFPARCVLRCPYL